MQLGPDADTGIALFPLELKETAPTLPSEGLTPKE